MEMPVLLNLFPWGINFSFIFHLIPTSLSICLFSPLPLIALSLSEGELVLSIKEEIITLRALTSKAFRARDRVCHLLRERHSKIGRERESECFPGQSSVKDYY